MKKKIIPWFLAGLMLASLLTGCGGSGKSASAAMNNNYAMDMEDIDMATEMGLSPWEETQDTPTAAIAAVHPAPQEGAKIIYTADMELESTQFDAAVAALADLTKELGGYYASSRLSNGGSYRTANYTIRVPADNYRDFLDRAGALCQLLDLYESTEDVSENYYDTAGRLETQQTKLDRLQELLRQSKGMEDIIALEDAISETEEEIDRLSGELRHYDRLVDYSTVTIQLREVYRLSDVEEPTQSFLSRIGGAFRAGWNGFVSGLEELAVALAYGWMWLILLAAAICLVAGLLIRRRRRRRAAKAVPGPGEDDRKA